MILDRETYIKNGYLKRLLLFLKKFSYILFRFLGRPNWGRLRAGMKSGLEKKDLVLFSKDGELLCNSCQICVEICLTQSLTVVKEVDSSQPRYFYFEPLKCITCDLCETYCPENALAFISEGGQSFHWEDDVVRDLSYLAYRQEKGLEKNQDESEEEGVRSGFTKSDIDDFRLKRRAHLRKE